MKVRFWTNGLQLHKDLSGIKYKTYTLIDIHLWLFGESSSLIIAILNCGMTIYFKKHREGK